MCLTKLTNFKTRKKYFYKLFSVTDDGIYGFCRNRNGTSVFDANIKYQRNRWYNSVPKVVRAVNTIVNGFYSYNEYTTGFHCFVSEEDAKSQCAQKCSSIQVLKVEVEDIMHKGVQYGKNCIVARRMRICP